MAQGPRRIGGCAPPCPSGWRLAMEGPLFVGIFPLCRCALAEMNQTNGNHAKSTPPFKGGVVWPCFSLAQLLPLLPLLSLVYRIWGAGSTAHMALPLLLSPACACFCRIQSRQVSVRLEHSGCRLRAETGERERIPPHAQRLACSPVLHVCVGVSARRGGREPNNFSSRPPPFSFLAWSRGFFFPFTRLTSRPSRFPRPGCA